MRRSHFASWSRGRPSGGETTHSLASVPTSTHARRARGPHMTNQDAIVFVVDDDPTLREALQGLVAAAGLRVARVVWLSRGIPRAARARICLVALCSASGCRQ